MTRFVSLPPDDLIIWLGVRPMNGALIQPTVFRFQPALAGATLARPLMVWRANLLNRFLPKIKIVLLMTKDSERDQSTAD